MLSVTLTIGGVDVTSHTRIESIRPSESLRDRANTLSGLELVIPYSGNTPEITVPRAGQEVILTVDGTREFGGVVQRVSESPGGSTSYVYTIDCSDYTRWLDRYLVQGVAYPAGESSETGTAGSIVRSIISDWANKGRISWDTSLVQDGETIPQQTFDFDVPSACIDRVAKTVGWRWYVDYNRRIVFGPPLSSGFTAPVPTINWETDTTVGDLVLEESGDQIVNVAYIKDAKTVATNPDGTAKPYERDLGETDGYQGFWGLGYEPSSLATTTILFTPATGSPTTYTVANGNLLEENIAGTPGDGQTRAVALLCLTNWGVRFEQPPAAGGRLRATYEYLDPGPAVWVVREGTSITEVSTREGGTNSDGVYEEVYSATDMDGASSDSVKQRAFLYLTTRSHKWSGNCKVFGTGWRAGQYLTITSSRRFGGQFANGLTFYVVDVRKRFQTPDADGYLNELVISSDVYGEL